jgi:hypothetical protein
MDGGSLAVEIGGDLAPGGSVPLEDRARGGVLAQPVVGAGDEVKERGVAGVGLQVGAAPALAHPGDGGFGIGVDRQGEGILFEKGKGVEDGKELTDIVGAMLEGSLAEKLPTAGEVETAPFEGSGAARAGGIHDVTFSDGGMGSKEPFLGGGGFPGVEGIFPGGGAFGLGKGGKGFVLRPGETADLGRTGLPIGEDAGRTPLPDNVKLPAAHDELTRPQDPVP